MTNGWKLYGFTQSYIYRNRFTYFDALNLLTVIFIRVMGHSDCIVCNVQKSYNKTGFIN